MEYRYSLIDFVISEFSHLPHHDPFVQAFSDFFVKKFGDSLLAVLFYGSRLFEVDTDAIYDFYVIVDYYEKVHSSPLHIILNRILPPSVYLAEVELDGEVRAAKYNIITLRDFKRYIIDPPEIYIVGRFSKRVHFSFVKNDSLKRKLAELMLDAAYFCLTYTIPLLDEREKFNIEDLIAETLFLSYKGEVRIEDPKKLDKIFLAFRDFYIRVYWELFNQYLLENEGVVIEIDRSERPISRTWAVVGNPVPSKQEVIKFLKVSARRGVMRWPKGLMTFKGYSKYLERKAKKAGEQINITYLDRKFPLIFGWRHLLKLMMEGRLKSGIQKEIGSKLKSK